MAGGNPIRVAAFLALASGLMLAQQAVSHDELPSLPDAPSVQLPSRAQVLRTALDTARQPLDVGSPQQGLGEPGYNPAEFQFLEARRGTSTFYTVSKSPSTSQRNGPGSTNARPMGRVVGAASSFIIKRDIAGRKHLNTPYLLSVATNAVADVAHTPYWRRSPAQPLSNFGSNIGNDAGMNVLHQFQPGILRLVTSHLPQVVSKKYSELTR